MRSLGSHSSVLASIVTASLLMACPGDDGSAESQGGSSTGGASSSSGPDLDGTTTTTTTPGTTGGTTETVDETGSSTGQGPSDGVCEGLSILGFGSTVFSRDGMPIDTTCDANPMPCGGDPVGTWQAESTCGYESFPNPLESDCPGSSFMLESIALRGTLTLENDGTYVEDIMNTLQASVSLDPMACFGTDCPGIEMVFQMDQPMATCQAMGPTCSCTIPIPDEPATMGTYQVMGDTLVATEDMGDTTEIPFCVTGDRLDIWQPIFDEPVVTETLCADEQDCLDALGDMYDFYVCSTDGMPGG